MALVVKRSSWACKFCNVSFPSADELCYHIVSYGHRLVLGKDSPEYLMEKGRLQYLLDTYLTGEPVLGLQYVVEQQAGSEFVYTCLLCDVKRDWLKMFTHVVKVTHVARYIDKHYAGQKPAPSDFPYVRGYIKALIEIAEVLREASGVTSLRHQSEAAPFEVAGGDQRRGEGRPGSEEGAAQHSLKRKKETKWHRDAKQPRWELEILKYLQNFTTRDHHCNLCDVFCPTTEDLYKHITGAAHGKLARSAPQPVKELSRLQNFLDTYMKGEPILGLGFVAEKEVDAAYVYNCLLCSVQEDCLRIFAHLLQVDHVVRYMDKYHRVFLPKPKNFSTRSAYVNAVIASSVRVYKKLGDASVPEAASEDDGEEDNPSPIDSYAAQEECSGVAEAKSVVITQELQFLGVSRFKNNFCTLCNFSFPNAVDLCEHLMKSLHRSMLKYAKPELLQKLTCLNYFLGTLMINEPFVGLQYILEKKQETSCLYSCLLCRVETNGLSMLLHIGGTKHIKLYIQNHHAELVHGTKVSSEILKTYASKICKQYGRQEIRCAKDICIPAGSTTGALPSKHNSKMNGAVSLDNKVGKEMSSCSIENSHKHSKQIRTLSCEQNCRIGDSASAKVAAASVKHKAGKSDSVSVKKKTSTRKVSKLDEHKPSEELAFKKNKDFLDYLSSFEIKDDGDASIMKQISQNCYNALKSFWKNKGLQAIEKSNMQLHAADTLK